MKYKLTNSLDNSIPLPYRVVDGNTNFVQGREVCSRARQHYRRIVCTYIGWIVKYSISQYNQYN